MPFGLLLASPLEFVDELVACGAMLAVMRPETVYWPLPDLQRMSHPIRALGRRAIAAAKTVRARRAGESGPGPPPASLASDLASPFSWLGSGLAKGARGRTSTAKAL